MAERGRCDDAQAKGVAREWPDAQCQRTDQSEAAMREAGEVRGGAAVVTGRGDVALSPRVGSAHVGTVARGARRGDARRGAATARGPPSWSRSGASSRRRSDEAARHQGRRGDETTTWVRVEAKPRWRSGTGGGRRSHVAAPGGAAAGREGRASRDGPAEASGSVTVVGGSSACQVQTALRRLLELLLCHVTHDLSRQ